MITAELLRKKRDGKPFDSEEIHFLVRGVVDGTVSEAQAAAFLMASCIRGLSVQETTALTLAMARSGTTFNFSGVGRPVVDKHSTGGVGDKVSLLLAPIAACCGLAVPMISGRGLGHTGGTVDKLESIVGMRMDFTAGEFDALLHRNGVFMARQTEHIAPADRTLYRLRDVTGTVESVGLLTSSILSKKFAEGLDALVMDVKVGNGAFLPALDGARELADSLKTVAREAGLAMRVLLTAMEQPLGWAVGNWPEVEETIQALGGDAPSDVRRVTEELCAAMLLASQLCTEKEEALRRVRSVWDSGEALQRFQKMVEAQGGDLEASRKQYVDIPRVVFRASADGVITHIRAREIGVAGIVLGVGRVRDTDGIDSAAGIIFFKKTGDEVRRGEEIGYVQGNRRESFEAVIAAVTAAIGIGRETPEVGDVVLEER